MRGGLGGPSCVPGNITLPLNRSLPITSLSRRCVILKSRILVFWWRSCRKGREELAELALLTGVFSGVEVLVLPQIPFRLRYVLGFAEVAPEKFIGTEALNLFSCAGEAQIAINN